MKQKKILYEKRLLFPGYIFIKTEFADEEFIKRAYNLIRGSLNVLRLLRYGEGNDANAYVLKNQEYMAILNLCNEAYCIECSSGYIEGDTIVITQGPLVGYESKIKRINRHKREAIVELDMLGCVREVKVGLEIVSKVK